MAPIRLVYRSPWNVLLALVAFVVMAVFYLWSSQVLIVGRHGISILVELRFIAAAGIMALLFGFLVPLEVYAFRLAAASRAQAGGTVLGATFGTMSMTCCAPVLLPSILSLLGFSGTTILSLNETLNRFWLPLATASVILLSYSLVSVIQSLEVECGLNRSTGVVSTEAAREESTSRELVPRR